MIPFITGVSGQKCSINPVDFAIRGIRLHLQGFFPFTEGCHLCCLKFEILHFATIYGKKTIKKTSQDAKMFEAPGILVDIVASQCQETPKLGFPQSSP